MDDERIGRERVGVYAASLVASGTVIGLGTGSTASEFVRALGVRVRDEKLDVTGVPTSEATAVLARSCGIALTTLDDHPSLDLAIDGADAVDPALECVKGLGGALLREKIVAHAARSFVLVVTRAKMVDALASAPPVPIECEPFGLAATVRAIASLGFATALRMRDGTPFRTDGGHVIVDARPPHETDAHTLARALKTIPGVIEHGWFLGMASTVCIAEPDGTVTLRKRPSPGT